MLKVAPAADAVRALFVGRRRMGATILRWLTVLIHLIWKQPVALAKAGAQAAASARRAPPGGVRRKCVFVRYVVGNFGNFRASRPRALRCRSHRAGSAFPAFAPNFMNLSRGLRNVGSPPTGFPGGGWGVGASGAAASSFVAVPEAHPGSSRKSGRGEHRSDWIRIQDLRHSKSMRISPSSILEK